jgi:hypothetical protein
MKVGNGDSLLEEDRFFYENQNKETIRQSLELYWREK